jgi:hypothetical protein
MTSYKKIKNVKAIHNHHVYSYNNNNNNNNNNKAITTRTIIDVDKWGGCQSDPCTTTIS